MTEQIFSHDDTNSYFCYQLLPQLLQEKLPVPQELFCNW